MKKFLFWFAVTGWVLGLTVHILSLAGFDVTEKFPFIWILHVGIFVVWIPAILELRKSEELKAFQRSGALTRMNPVAYFAILGKNAPKWMIVVAIGGLVYAVFNFLLFMSLGNGTAGIQNGHYVLQNHGQWIRDLTPQQYHSYQASMLRGFSGHWIAFYGIAMLVLFPPAQTAARDLNSVKH
jgi:hypothetical protein